MGLGPTSQGRDPALDNAGFLLVWLQVELGVGGTQEWNQGAQDRL